MDAMDRALALQTLSWCDQIERALADGDQPMIDMVTLKLLKHIALAREVDLRVAIECARARAQQVLSGEDDSL